MAELTVNPASSRRVRSAEKLVIPDKSNFPFDKYPACPGFKSSEERSVPSNPSAALELPTKMGAVVDAMFDRLAMVLKKELC